MDRLRILIRTAFVPFLLACLCAGQAAYGQAADAASWYEVEDLNRGLGPVPADVDRTTPRSSLESFLAEAREGDWHAAAQVLDLSAIPENEQRTRGAQLAMDFLVLLERKIVIDWYDLQDRPDGLDSRQASEAAMAGKPRRSLLLWYVDLDNRPIPIRLNRVKSGQDPPVWVLSSQTVDNLPQLADAYGPSRLELMLPQALRESAVWGLRLWEVVALPLGLMLTAFMGWLTHRVLSKGFNRDRRIAPESLRVAARGPLILLVMTVTLSLVTKKLFVFSGRIDTILSPLEILGIVAAILWLVVNVADAILARLVSFDGGELSEIGDGQEERRAMATKVSAVRRLLIVLIVFIGAGIVLNEASVMQSLGLSLLASAGTITLVAAFAARNILSNIMASLQIAMNQSARIGDKIVFRDHLCSVERINFTFVQLRVWTGKRLVVPVVDFVDEPFENWTMQEPFLLMQVILRLRHDADVEPLREAYHGILDEMDEEDEQRDSRGAYVSDHDVFGLHVLFLVPCQDPNTAWTRACEVRERLLREARKIDAETTPLFPQVQAMDAV